MSIKTVESTDELFSVLSKLVEKCFAHINKETVEIGNTGIVVSIESITYNNAPSLWKIKSNKWELEFTANTGRVYNSLTPIWDITVRGDITSFNKDIVMLKLIL